jgi:hypothetical protein
MAPKSSMALSFDSSQVIEVRDMDEAAQVFKILGALGKGDESLRRLDWSMAVKQYSEATETLAQLPPSEPFDRRCFVASCLAGAATANIGLGNHAAALQCAENALSFFDRAGDAYPAERGKWVLATAAKGIAASVLRRTGEAEKCRLRTREILARSQGNLNFQPEIDRLIKTLDDLLLGDRIEARSWWQFWK